MEEKQDFLNEGPPVVMVERGEGAPEGYVRVSRKVARRLLKYLDKQAPGKRKRPSKMARRIRSLR